MQRHQANAITTIDFLRHGACEGGDIYRGSTDVPLSALGWQQMENSIAAELALSEQAPWQTIISSPLQRCRQFAETKAGQFRVPVRVLDDFREMHFGDWEGREISEVQSNDAQSVAAFYADPANTCPPNGESIGQLHERLMPALQTLLAEHTGEHILLVQHGVTIRALLSWVLDMPLSSVTRLEIPYASLSRIQVYHVDEQYFPRLMFMNRIHHG